MPSHRHSIQTQNFTPSGSTANRGAIVEGGSPGSNTAINTTGGGEAHNNLQPYLTTNFIIKS